jgi:glutathione S-transferase
MKLYDSIGPNPRVVRMFAAEKGVELERETVDVMGAENRSEPYLRLNASGTTPAFELPSGQIVCEVVAICEYLEEVRPSPPLIGATPEARAETRMWTRRIDLGIVEPMTMGFRATGGRRLFEPRMKLVSSQAGEELLGIARDKLLWLDAQMRGRPFVCGDRFTLADILLFAFMDFGGQVGQPIPDDAIWTRDWFERVKARPSAAA